MPHGAIPCAVVREHTNGFNRRMKKTIDRLSFASTTRGCRVPQPALRSPFVLDVPPHLQKRWLFEVSPNPSFIPSAGWFGKGSLMDFTERQWSMLAPGQYFGRLGKPVGFKRCSRAVSWFIKSDISEI